MGLESVVKHSSKPPSFSVYIHLCQRIIEYIYEGIF
nr:MAG TPA: hypothetical protein [Bacteriophage sp.]